MCIKKLFASKIKTQQGVPAGTAGTTLDFMVEKVINLIPKQGFTIRENSHTHTHKHIHTKNTHTQKHTLFIKIYEKSCHCAGYAPICQCHQGASALHHVQERLAKNV